jgi:hypothetical protein
MSPKTPVKWASSPLSQIRVLMVSFSLPWSIPVLIDPIAEQQDA